MGEQVISAADLLIDEELIIQLMPLAEATGRKYAHKYHKFEPECIAEAYYQLVLLVKNKSKLLFNANNMGGYVRISISKALGRYFRFTREVHVENNYIAEKFKLFAYDDFEMIDWLEHHFAEATEVYKYMREGFDLDDIEYLKPKFKSLCKEVNQRKAKRLKQLHKLDNAGIMPLFQPGHNVSINSSIPGSKA